MGKTFSTKIFNNNKNILLLLLLIMFIISCFIIHTDIGVKKVMASGAEVYWGAHIDGSLYSDQNPPWDMNAVTTFEQHTGKQISIIAMGFAWYHDTTWPAGTSYNGYYPFESYLFDTIRNHGSIPMVTWSSANADKDYTDPAQSAFTLSNIINGTYDAYITQWATDSKNWGHPYFLRFDWEMNGDWYPWSEQTNGNSAGQYVQAWRHIHDIFTTVGATNVTWVWCVNTEYSGSIPISELYPGNSYVDWIGVDGYNNGNISGNSWKSFYNVFNQTYTDLNNLAPSKPIMIAEVASAESGGTKSSWITDMLSTQLPQNFPLVKAFLWFNFNWGYNYQIESTTNSQTAFQTGISSSYYASNTFSTLSQNPIQPLGSTPTPTPTPLPIPSPNPQPIASYSSSITLSGIKDTSIVTVFVNGSSSGVTYPDSTHWQLNNFSLSLGSNSISIYGKDASNNQSSITTLSINRNKVGDINGDNSINLTDFSIFATDWLHSSNAIINPLSDMNNDGIVNLTDLSIFAADYNH